MPTSPKRARGSRKRSARIECRWRRDRRLADAARLRPWRPRAAHRAAAGGAKSSAVTMSRSFRSDLTIGSIVAAGLTCGLSRKSYAPSRSLARSNTPDTLPDGRVAAARAIATSLLVPRMRALITFSPRAELGPPTRSLATVCHSDGSTRSSGAAARPSKVFHVPSVRTATTSGPSRTRRRSTSSRLRKTPRTDWSVSDCARGQRSARLNHDRPRPRTTWLSRRRHRARSSTSADMSPMVRF